MKTKVCHFTSGHDSYDERVFVKQCCTLYEAGYDVFLVTPSNENEERNGVHICGANVEGYSRFLRILFASRKVYKKALSIDADIYHFHDPELIPYGLKLKKMGKRVIFDSHEDTPMDILAKVWIPLLFRPFISKLYSAYESYAVKKFDGVISITPHVVDRLIKINPKTFLVTNYPIVDEAYDEKAYQDMVIGKYDDAKLRRTICYIGRIGDESMQRNVVRSLEKLDDISYVLAGPASPNYIEMLSNSPGGDKINYTGTIKFSESQDFFSKAIAGIQLTDYIPQFGYKIGSLGNTKIFGYMRSGLPVICTDFILWKQIIEKYDCGICVNPNNINEIADAIKYIINNPVRAKEMGQNGKKAAYKEFNWASQAPSLLKLYDSLE